MTKLVSVYRTMVSSIKGSFFYNVMAHLPFIRLCLLWLCLLVNLSYVFIWLCFHEIYISSLGLFIFNNFHQFESIFIFYQPMKNLFVLNKGELFYFSFCSLCPIVEPSLHSYVLNFFVSVSFRVLLVRACCSTSLECPSMFWALS